MLFGVGVSCRILHSIVSYLYVSCSVSIISYGEEKASLLVIRRGFLFLLGWAAIFHCGFPWAFHIIILQGVCIMFLLLLQKQIL